MARSFFSMACLLLVLAAQHSVRAKSTEDIIAKQMQKLNENLEKLWNLTRPVVEILTNESSAMKTTLQNVTLELQETKSKLQGMEEKLQDVGSTFVRWGRKTCPANTTLVYSGLAGGKKYNHQGSGTNRLCLTKSPQFDNSSVPYGHGSMYGAEYARVGNLHNHDVPCSVCRAPQASTIMMAATLTCPKGWTKQYTGHLSSQNQNNQYGTEYVCLDGNPEKDDTGTGGEKTAAQDKDGLIFSLVITACGSLPCPPFKTNSVVTCAVCSQ